METSYLDVDNTNCFEFCIKKQYICLLSVLYLGMNRIRQSIMETSSRRLDELNQAIWNNGFTTETLTALGRITEEVNNGTTLFERIPQAQQPGLSKGTAVLTAAGLICRGCPGTESELREIYRTDDLVGEGRIQERLVEAWARITGCWYDSPELYLSSLSEVKDYGTESEVYFDVDQCIVRKMISLKHYNILRLALDRIIIHNAIFPDTGLKVIGFGRNLDKQFVVIVEQPYCRGGIVSEKERCDFMYALGFQDAGEDFGMHLNYCTDSLYIGDLNEYNVIKGDMGIYVIDADCRLNTPTLGCGGSFVVPSPHLDFSNPCPI